MSVANKKGLIEGLVFAGVVGLVALFLTSMDLLSDTRRGSFDREALASLARRPVLSAATKARDPDFSRIYRVGGKGESLFGVVLTLRSTKGSALTAALFDPAGELRAARLIGASPSRQPYSSEGWFADFLGDGDGSAFPAVKAEARDPAAVSGATESFLVTGEVLGRASIAVRAAAAGERP